MRWERKAWGSYFKFAIERNPFDRAISTYWWVTRGLQARPDVNQFLADAPASMLSQWEMYADGDDVIVDYIIRHEALEGDLAVVGEKLGLELSVPRARAKSAHRLDRRHYREVLSPTVRGRIEAVCRREMEAFGYRW